jgi:hypothetical protein
MAAGSLHFFRKLCAGLQKSWVKQTRPKGHRGRRMVLEALEDRLTPSAGVQEQYMLDLINRFRANPTAELSLILAANDPNINDYLIVDGVNMTTLEAQLNALTPEPPLAWSDDLANSALGHSQLMLADQSQSHQLPGEPALATRIANAGYTNDTICGENIFAWATSVFQGEAAFLIDWANGTSDGLLSPPGHRINLMYPTYQEVGIGLVSSSIISTGMGPLLVTQDFGAQSNLGNPFLLGNVYNDLNNDGFYEPGEGLSGVNLAITGPGGTFQTTSTPAGGYQIQLPAGTYQVTASGGGLATPLIKTVTIGSNNVQADFIGTQATGPASPTLVGTPNPTSVTLGAAATTLKDSAVLSGGSSPTGTVTFTLYKGSTLLDTESVTVSGNGTYTTPAGYTLPTTGTETGTYQWDVSYNGNTNNNPASENNNAAEQVVVSKAGPTVVATPNPTTVTLGTTATTLKDSAVLSGGYNQTGSITFTLNLGSTVLDTETVTVSGNGTYTTPTGYTLPNTGTVTGTYQWNVSYNGDTNNNPISENNNAAEQVVVSKAGPTIVGTPNPTTVTLGTTATTLKDSTVLSGGSNPTGTITFTLYQGSTLLDTESVTVSGNGTYTTPTGYTLPTSGTVTGTYQWNVSYIGDTNNNAVSLKNSAAEQVVVSPAISILDDSSSQGFATTGSWGSYSGSGPMYDGNMHYAPAGTGSNVASWTLTVTPGLYDVAATWWAWAGRASNAPYTVLDGSTPLGTVPINQQLAPSGFSDQGGTWQDLGSFTILGNQLVVRLSDNANGYVIADAIRIDRLGNAATVQVQDGATPIASGGSDSFGTANVGAPLTRTFTVKNAGAQTLTLGTLGSMPAGFTLTQGFGSTSLAAGASTTFQVSLSTTVVGSYNGTLSFTSSDPNFSSYRWSVSGTVQAVSTVQILDDSSSQGFATTGSWGNYSGSGPMYNGNMHYAPAGTGSNVATWTFTVTPGQYDVSVTWWAWAGRASNAPYTVLNGSTALGTALVNQQLAPSGLSDQGSTWQDLGSFTILGNQLVVRLSDNANGYVIADAIRIAKVG